MSVAPELRPVSGMGAAPTLTAIDGRVEITTPGELDRTIAAGVVASIARYDTVLEIRRKPTEPVRRMKRVGWRLLDANGNAVAWLVNSDRVAYAETAVRRFADGAGLQVVDSGFISRDELLADSGDRIGPGTSAVSSFVAPTFQWALTIVVLGGVALGIAPALRNYPEKPPTGWAVLGGFIGLFVGAFVAARIGAIQHIWREQRYRRRGADGSLRSIARTPGLRLTVSGGYLRVSDYLHSWDGPLDSATLVPYDVTGSGRRDEVGMIVRWKGGGYVDITERFDANEVASFAAAHGIAVAQAHREQLPKEPDPDKTARPDFINRWRKLAWLAPVLWLLAAAAPVLVVLAVAGVLPLPLAASVAMLGCALLIVGGYLVAKNRFSDSLIRPERV